MPIISLASNIAGINVECCIYNASGPRTGSIEALSKIGSSRSGVILSKSATLVQQNGNDLPRFVNKIDLGKGTCQGSMNSEGLPNLGIDYYISDEALSALKKHNKPYIVSISGLSVEDNLAMLSKIMTKEEVDAIELNLACPNIPGKPIIAYDFEQMDKVLCLICNHKDFNKKPVGVKLPPYFDGPYFEQAASIIAKYPVKYVVCINTIGNALLIDYENETTLISPKEGYGGLGGGYVKPTALANVNTMFKLLNKKDRSDIDVVGVGGISSGRDAFEMILCGAKAVQIGTCHWTEGSECFERIAKELEQIMISKGYSSIEEFRGKLKPYSKDIVKKKNSLPTKNISGDTVSKDNNSNIYLILHLMVAILMVSVTYCIKNNYAPFAF